MILVDSNVPMYLVGADHPNKLAARLAVESLLLAGERLVTDAEVLQEILHRYAAIGRPEHIQPALDVLLEVTDEVFPIERADVLTAKDVLFGSPSMSARDAVHIAVMKRRRIPRVLTFDRGFDAFPGIARLP